MAMCYTDIETRETVRRLREVFFTFGMDAGDIVDDSVSLDVFHLREFLLILRERETKRRRWTGSSPELEYRKHAVDFVMKVCHKEKLSRDTVYQAIYILDRFMDTHSIPADQVHFVSLTCVVISGKLMESDKSSPKFRGVIHHLPSCMSADEKVKMLVIMEELILKWFSFEVLVPTEITFLDVYLLYAAEGWVATNSADNQGSTCLHDSGSSDNNNNENVKDVSWNSDSSGASVYLFEQVPGHEVVREMQLTAYDMLEEYNYHIHRNSNELKFEGVTNNFSPSLIAAAIMLAVRRQCGLNSWTPTLVEVTSYQLEPVAECLFKWVLPRVPETGKKQPPEPPAFLNVVFRSHIVHESPSNSP